jgi:hypothetical protein
MHALGCARFWLWALAGALLAFSVVGAASIGLFVLPFAVIAFVFAARAMRNRAELLGLLAGAATICLLIGLIQLGGGGLDPRPWFAAGGVLGLVGVGGFALLGRGLTPRA